MSMGLGFPDKKVMAELTAKMLLEVEAVRFMDDKPFIFTSGWASPVYTDCRRLISFPRVRQTLDGLRRGDRSSAMSASSSSTPWSAARPPASRSRPGWPTA